MAVPIKIYCRFSPYRVKCGMGNGQHEPHAIDVILDMPARCAIHRIRVTASYINVADNEVLVSIQRAEQGLYAFNSLANCKVAEMPDLILSLDGAIAALDHGFVHFLH